MRDLSPRWNRSSSVAGTRAEFPSNLSHPAVDGTRGRIKRSLDIGIALMAGFALIPVMMVVAALILFANGGPVLYSQTRAGLGGRPFTMFKFRTMRGGAEPGESPIWAVFNDPRCTRLGSWLRRSGFDELPQIWNVLRGDMSVVGPRPERPEFVKQFSSEHEGYLERQDVPAGLTGYAQVHGWRGDTDMGERIRHDRYYVRHWSLAMDLRILLATLRYGWSERTRDGVAG